MSIVHHDAIIVTTWDQRHMQAFVDAAAEIGVTIVGPCCCQVNMYRTALVVPDGSKEGWEPSNQGDDRRRRLIEWLDAQRYHDGSTPFEWVAVSYGADMASARVGHHAWNRRHRKTVPRDRRMGI